MILEISTRGHALKNLKKIIGAIRSDVHWFGVNTPEAEKRWVRLAANCYLVNKFQLWKELTSKGTKKTFHSFYEWLQEEAGRSKAQVTA